MKSFKSWFKFILVFSAFFLILLSLGWKKRYNINLAEFLKELTIVNVKDSQTQTAVWLPFEFNVNAIGDNVEMRTDSSLKSYLIFMIQCSINRADSQTIASWSEIQNRAFLKGVSHARLKPLALVPVEISRNLEAIRTAIAENGGSTINMHMLVFDINDPNGKVLIDTAKRDKLTLVLEPSSSFSKAEFVWHTPFDAVVDAGNCPDCGEKIKAQWCYCPWCGNKL
jgi:hypothetical protein